MFFVGEGRTLAHTHGHKTACGCQTGAVYGVQHAARLPATQRRGGECPPLASQSTRPTLTNCRIVHGPTPSCPHLLLLLLLLVIAHPVQQAQHAMLLQGDSCRYGDN